MAGMLPGVESARRRRFHKTNSLTNYYGSDQIQTTSSRRSSYATSHDLHSNSFMVRNPLIRQESTIMCDESKLGAAAREAKKRLDERLQPQWRSQNKRIESSTLGSQERSTFSENRPNITRSNFSPEVPNLKRSALKRPSWLKLGRKSLEQDECAVCLEQLQARPGGTLMQLPCAHRFHTNCLVPWLKGNAHCPCCRLEIPSL